MRARFGRRFLFKIQICKRAVVFFCGGIVCSCGVFLVVEEADVDCFSVYGDAGTEFFSSF